MAYARSGLTARQFFDAWVTAVPEARTALLDPEMAEMCGHIVSLAFTMKHGQADAPKAVAYYRRLLSDARGAP